jgi:excisionase family DNA binding protein
MVQNKENSFLTVTEVSTLLHIHPNTLRRWCEEGRLVAYRINARGDRRFKLDDIQRFIDQFNAYKDGE